MRKRAGQLCRGVPRATRSLHVLLSATVEWTMVILVPRPKRKSPLYARRKRCYCGSLQGHRSAGSRNSDSAAQRAKRHVASGPIIVAALKAAGSGLLAAHKQSSK